MTNIIQFPQKVIDKSVAGQAIAPLGKAGKNLASGVVKQFFRGAVVAVWMVLILVWPVARWVISIEAFFQLLRMVWYWDNPNVHAGWTFILHFGVLVVLTYFVMFWKPKEF